MKLVENNSKFELRIIDYECRHPNNSDDASWLIIEIGVIDNSGASWRAKDSCLRTFEIVALRDWLESIKNNGIYNTSISFTENELAFRYIPENMLDIILDFRFHPKGNDYDYNLDEEYVLQFKLNEKKLTHLIDDLTIKIKKYPDKNL